MKQKPIGYKVFVELPMLPPVSMFICRVTD